MELTYSAQDGSWSITLEIVKTRLFQQEAVYDASGTDYLYTKFTIDVQAVINPAATTYSLQQSLPTYDYGTLPAITIRSIRHFLMQPRQILSCSIAGNQLLVSPQQQLIGTGNAATVDAADGPKPIFCNITEITGQTTFLIHYKIETCLNECLSAVFPAELLSNRWSQSHVVDEQHMVSIITQGTAYFRSDLMADIKTNPDGGTPAPNGLTPDMLRAQILPPVPLHCQRKSIQVAVSEDNLRMTYTVIDKETFYSLGRNMQAGDNQKTTQGINRWNVTKFEAILEITSQPPDKDNSSAASLRSIHRCIVRAWGNKSSVKWNLMVFCLQIIIDKLQISAPQMVGGKLVSDGSIVNAARLQHHLHDKIVEVEFVVSRPPVGAIKDKTLGYLDWFPMEGNRSEFLPVQNGGVVPIPLLPGPEAGSGQNPGKGKNLQPPYSANTRGTYQAYINQQVLQTACEAVPRLGDVSAGATVPVPSGGGSFQLKAEHPPTKAKLMALQITQTQPTLSVTGYSTSSNDNIYLDDVPETFVLDGVLNNVLNFGTSQLAPIESSTSWITDYRVDMKYDTDYHAIQCPVALSVDSESTSRVPAQFFYSAAPTGKLRIKFTGERVGAVPLLPAPVTNDTNLVLLASQVMPVAPIVMPDNVSIIYRVSGEYVYGMLTYQGAGDALSLGVLPWTVLDYSKQSIAETDWQHGIIDEATQVQRAEQDQLFRALPGGLAN